jgi:translation initiation factor 5B
LLKLQKQQEEIRRREEDAVKAVEAERARIAEIERQEQEEEKRKEEAKALRKQKEKERTDLLKKEGKFMTPAQKAEKLRNELKLQQMRDAGLKIGGLEADGVEKKKVVYDSKKKKGAKKNPEELKVNLFLRPQNESLQKYRPKRNAQWQMLPSEHKRKQNEEQLKLPKRLKLRL